MLKERRRLCFLLLGIALILALVLAVYFWQRGAAGPASEFLALDHTFSEKDVHARFGEPQGSLSGFWGDIYAPDDGTEVIIYYDNNGYVSEVKALSPEK